ncbi:MAG: hypothetical protein ACK4YV_10325 [Emticicia sp.]
MPYFPISCLQESIPVPASVVVIFVWLKLRKQKIGAKIVETGF